MKKSFLKQAALLRSFLKKVALEAALGELFEGGCFDEEFLESKKEKGFSKERSTNISHIKSRHNLYCLILSA